MSKVERQLFFRRIGEARGAKAIREIVKELHIVKHYETQKANGVRAYLPLKVWEVRGFPVERIRENGDHMWDNEFGWVFGASVSSRSEEEGLQNTWSESYGGPPDQRAGDKQKPKRTRRPADARCPEKIKRKKAQVLARLVRRLVSTQMERISAHTSKAEFGCIPQRQKDRIAVAKKVLMQCSTEAENATNQEGELTFTHKELREHLEECEYALEQSDSMMKCIADCQNLQRRKKRKIRGPGPHAYMPPLLAAAGA